MSYRSYLELLVGLLKSLYLLLMLLLFNLPLLTLSLLNSVTLALEFHHLEIGGEIQITHHRKELLLSYQKLDHQNSSYRASIAHG